MKREAQLAFCRNCKHKKMDLKRGLLCGLTNDFAAFEDACEDYVERTPTKKETRISFNDSLENQTASHGKRIANLVIDTICIYIISFLLGVIIALSGGIDFIEGGGSYVVSILSYIGFYLVFEGVLYQTPGKFATQTIVVDENGNVPTMGKVFGRTLCRFIPFEKFSFIGGSAIGWHDKITQTRVIEKKYFEKKEEETIDAYVVND